MFGIKPTSLGNGKDMDLHPWPGSRLGPLRDSENGFIQYSARSSQRISAPHIAGVNQNLATWRWKPGASDYSASPKLVSWVEGKKKSARSGCVSKGQGLFNLKYKLLRILALGFCVCGSCPQSCPFFLHMELEIGGEVKTNLIKLVLWFWNFGNVFCQEYFWWEFSWCIYVAPRIIYCGDSRFLSVLY